MSNALNKGDIIKMDMDGNLVYFKITSVSPLWGVALEQDMDESLENKTFFIDDKYIKSSEKEYSNDYPEHTI